ncbi:MAG: AraC family transcriptional regulator [Bacteroidota bacterium]|nr:AraC family transcriptional regulator [Bacteroidota bacterium]MDP4217645.1 AraC family transcriptional regulator [Bacteroidota bacterium]MDP4245563.1 AraC family transcriptional regulator [Bacteroidota bacterium]MDP4256542.1 AraC family transcriptional regulator [Bacteroidota bacterium]MDP4257332.1 AraC family transcriptional regulator [Bacteroidota bacterium]
MVNFFERVLQHPQFYRQFNCGKSLITAFNCPMEARLMKTRFADLWTQYNYLFYVIDGQKTWHTAQGSYHIQKDSCVFVRKGGFILEQLADTGFCVVLFFIPDEFICDTLQIRSKPLINQDRHFEPVMLLDSSETLKGFFLSMSSYFAETQDPDPSLLELKFKELVLNIADNAVNKELLSYFCSLIHEPGPVPLKRVMEDNFCYNLGLDVYAQLCNRSLSAFKRDFAKTFRSTPGKWLLEKRLHHALHLMRNKNKTVAEAAFESGFENPSHFSRAFKMRFGRPPAAMKDHEPSPM